MVLDLDLRLPLLLDVSEEVPLPSWDFPAKKRIEGWAKSVKHNQESWEGLMMEVDPLSYLPGEVKLMAVSDGSRLSRRVLRAKVLAGILGTQDTKLLRGHVPVCGCLARMVQ